MKRGWLDQEMSFSRAAAELQRQDDPIGRKLRNLVIKREQEIGKRIAIRMSEGREPKLRVTIGALYRHFPELRPAQIGDLVRLMKPMLEKSEVRTRSLVLEEIAERVMPRLERVEKRATIIEKCLRELGDVERGELSRTGKN
jgi:hypothetical protein